MSALRIGLVDTHDVSRAPMLNYFLSELAEANGEHWRVRSGGLDAHPDDPLHPRVPDALRAIEELAPRPFDRHRATRVPPAWLGEHDVIFCFEADHVRRLRDAAPTDVPIVSLVQFVRDAPLEGSLVSQARSVARATPDEVFDLPSPTTDDDVVACAQELWQLAQVVATLAGV